jgi:alpha-beta hydrolase superfamily lysophospholipase
MFPDQSFTFEFLRVMAKALEHGSDIGECLETALRIKEDGLDPQVLIANWYKKWLEIARRIHQAADDCLARGHRVSARDAYFRASEYYRSADFYLHENPGNPAILELSENMLLCFNKARELSTPVFEAIEIPYEGSTLPGYFCPADGGGPAPTLIIHQGFDGTAEETYFGYGRAVMARGYNCLLFEGPGQGSVIRKLGLPFRYDWEKVVTPVVDYALKKPEVDPKRIALMGLSMGGVLAPRAAAYEHRLAALIANAGIYDLFENHLRGLGLTRAEAIKMLTEKSEEYDQAVGEAMEKSVQVYWGITNGMWVFQAKTPSELQLKQEKFHVRDCAHLIKCPTLVIDSEAEQFFPGQARQLYHALTCPKTFLVFKAGEGSELHCQAGGHLLGNQQILDWLDETFTSLIGKAGNP